MNKKGQAIFVGIGIGFMVFIVLVQFITPIKDQITIARNADGLDCTNSSISVGTKATCVVIDFTLPYFVWVVMGAAIGGIAGFAASRLVKS